ncbi:MAG: flippase-like domain-containing protein [Deltaproteobacteria bacterium]|nr:flippase-like domain-containing protein [Deltaproteobacteria bacterium]
MVAALALVLTVRKVGLLAIAKYFRLIGWWWIAVFVLEVVITSLDAVAIRAFMSPEQHKVGFRHALLSQLAGRSVNAVTPSGNVGEAVKVSVLTEHVSTPRAVSTILLYNIVSFSVELLMVAVAAPFLALLLPMPGSLRAVFLLAAVICAALSIGLYLLVHRGMLASLARAGVRLNLLSEARFERWQSRLGSVDEKLRLVAGARARDRWLGIAAVIMSRLISMTLSLVILHAIGEPITVSFVAGYTVGGFVVYMAASLVPMGLGISEGGTYGLFKALGENPARGTALVIARRVTLVAYAAIGLVLVITSETVRRAREAHKPVVAPAVADSGPTVAPIASVVEATE